MARTFEDKPATLENVPLLLGLYGPSGGGKTYSALRLATGIQRLNGGDIHVIDTEAKRSSHYAKKFTFRHVEFVAPFGPLDYLAAIEHCVSRGAGTVIVDSMSHEHEGPGGVLEMHDAEVKRLGGGERNNFPAWARPKGERRRLINRILQLKVNAIFCFRAKEKAKPGKDPETGKKVILDMGWMPIAGEEFVYEMTMMALLTPGADGVPTWDLERNGERSMVKRPEQFRALLTPGRQIDEDLGEAMARWASGSPAVTGVFRFPKGPHAGKLITVVPLEYLVDLQSRDVPADLKTACAAEIARREPEPETEAAPEQETRIPGEEG